MSEIALEAEKCLLFTRKLKSRIVLFIKGSDIFFLKIPLLTFYLFFESLRSFFYIREIRLTFNQCDEHCLNQDCLKDERIETVRDNYIAISEIISKIPVTNFLIGRLFKKTLCAWDDLVEDMTIASDAEFRKLITQIAQKIA